MTNVTGSIFISYRRSPARSSGDEEARLVCHALRDRGVPTWRDLDDLNSVPTEDGLRATLSSKEIAGAVLLISPEVETSDMIRKVEAPEIFERFQRMDGFFVQPVLINLDYKDVDKILDNPGGFQNISNFNIHRIQKESLDAKDVRQIAKAILKMRLGVIRSRDPNQKLSVGLYSRLSPSAEGLTLLHNFTPYFTNRDAEPMAYKKIETALFDAASTLAATSNQTPIPIVASGNAALPLGVLFGAVYSSFVFNLIWKQFSPWGDLDNWSIKSDTSHISTIVRNSKDCLTSEDLLLAVSVNAFVDPAAVKYARETGLSLRAMISVGLQNGPLQRGQSITAQQGLKVAREAISAARRLKDELRMEKANLHLFLACPLALAVLVGQDLNTFGECFLYEHFSDRKPSYKLVHSFRPSNFTYKFKTKLPFFH